MLRALDSAEAEYGVYGSAYTDTWYSKQLWWMVFFIIPVWLANWIVFWLQLTIQANYIESLPYQVACTGFLLFIAFPQLSVVSHMRPVYFSDLMIRAKRYDDWIKTKIDRRWIKSQHNKAIVHRYQVIFRWCITFISALMLWILTLVLLMRTGDIDSEGVEQSVDWKVKLSMLGGIAAVYSTVIQYTGKALLFIMTFAREETVKKLNEQAEKTRTTIELQRRMSTPEFRAAASIDLSQLHKYNTNGV